MCVCPKIGHLPEPVVYHHFVIGFLSMCNCILGGGLHLLTNRCDAKQKGLATCSKQTAESTKPTALPQQQALPCCDWVTGPYVLPANCCRSPVNLPFQSFDAETYEHPKKVKQKQAPLMLREKNRKLSWNLLFPSFPLYINISYTHILPRGQHRCANHGPLLVPWPIKWGGVPHLLANSDWIFPITYSTTRHS